MLKCKIDKKTGRIYVKTKGDLTTIAVEALVLLKRLHCGIERQNPEAAKEFKNVVIGTMLDPRSPVWKETEK